MGALSLRLPEDLERQLSSEAQLSGQPRSQLIREALEALLKQRQRQRTEAALVAAAQALALDPSARARVRAALRRAPASDTQVRTLRAGDFQVDLEARAVRVREQDVHLTPKEYELLVYLLRHPNKVLTHRTLLGAVWGGDYTEQTEYLRVFIGQLRKKIESDAAHPRYILTDPWVGYRFHPEG